MAREVHDPAARFRGGPRAWSLRRRSARNGNNATHDAAGNMTDDGVYYTYVYDPFGRLKTVKTRGGSPATVSEYAYNGLGHRIGWHYDADADADVDGNDPWYWFFYDERWRMVATYRGSDSNPKERFVYHNAGANGYGGSSYIDSVICRESDDSVDWKTAAPDSTLQTRYYYLQNWRADVVALIQADGVPLEYVRYSAYGVPFVYAAADVNRDGQVDILDTYAWDDFTGSTTGDIAVSPDVNRDGATNSADATFISDWDGTGLWSNSGRGFVSRLDSRKGYAGYEFDPATTQWHVRHRVLVSEMGRGGKRELQRRYDEMANSGSADAEWHIDSLSLYDAFRAVVGIDTGEDQQEVTSYTGLCIPYLPVSTPPQAADRCKLACFPHRCTGITNCTRYCIHFLGICTCKTICKYHCDDTPVRCRNIGSGGCTGTPLTKRCTYSCDNGTQVNIYLPCAWRGDSPPCATYITR